MKLITWNVNSIRTRLARLLAVLERHAPDALCLQELKCRDEHFPHDAVRAAGYHAAVFGQKTYNGVAILARAEPGDVRRGIGDAVDRGQARVIAADVAGVRVVCCYVPNGGSVDSEKWAYKRGFLAGLAERLPGMHTPDVPLVLCGDLNVAVDDSDVAKPDAWTDSVLTHADIRADLQAIADWGLVDCIRQHHPDGGPLTWWDYRQLAFPKGNGLRIDHIWATAPLAARCTAAWVDRDERKGKQPSDHAPVIAEFDV